MEQKKVRMDYKVLTEKIFPDNVAVMAELIAMRETRALIGYMGYHAEKAHTLTSKRNSKPKLRSWKQN